MDKKPKTQSSTLSSKDLMLKTERRRKRGKDREDLKHLQEGRDDRYLMVDSSIYPERLYPAVLREGDHPMRKA